MKINQQNGFTLVEILIVVSIVVVLGIAILVGINPLSQIFKGYDTRRKADLNTIKIALESYYEDHTCFPEFSPSEEIEGRFTYTCGSDVLSPYLASMPCDPNTKKPYLIHLLPEDSTCPQQYVVYATTTSLFDSQANQIPYCPNTIAINSADVVNIELNKGCNPSRDPCFTLWTCHEGECVWFSDGELAPPASSKCNTYCVDPITQTSNCGNNCVKKKNNIWIENCSLL